MNWCSATKRPLWKSSHVDMLSTMAKRRLKLKDAMILISLTWCHEQKVHLGHSNDFIDPSDFGQNLAIWKEPNFGANPSSNCFWPKRVAQREHLGHFLNCQHFVFNIPLLLYQNQCVANSPPGLFEEWPKYTHSTRVKRILRSSTQ